MIIEKLAKVDGPKRKSAGILAVLVIAGICYLIIPGGFVAKLRASKTEYTDMQTTYADTTEYDADFLSLQTRLKDIEQKLEEQKQICFSSKQAFLFFENMDTLAVAHNLEPISRVISKLQSLTVTEEAEPEQQFLKTQSANIIVAGNYFDIVDFVNELANRPQSVRMTGLNIALPPGAKFNPNASFDVTVLLYLSEEVGK